MVSKQVRFKSLKSQTMMRPLLHAAKILPLLYPGKKPKIPSSKRVKHEAPEASWERTTQMKELDAKHGGLEKMLTH